MTPVTIRQRNQMTLPPEAVAALGLQVGDVGDATVQGNALIVRFRSRTAARRAVDSAYGGASGAWGATHLQTEEAIARDRQSWDREGT